jgi:hypothetical protein
MIAPGAAPQLDFAIIGNDPETLGWLRRTLAALPGVRLADAAEGTDRGEARTGAVHALGKGAAPGARRLAIVLRDPVVALLATRTGATDDPGAPGHYAEVIAGLMAKPGERPLVVAAEDLAESPASVDELFAHLGIEALETSVTAPARPATIAAGRRATLFSSVRDDVEKLERLCGRTFRTWRFATPSAEPTDNGMSLLYVGRRRDVEAPEGSVALTDWDVLPFRLAPLLDKASALTVLDPMSFPFDTLRESDRAIPLAVRLPGGWDAGELVELFGEPVLGEVTPFDAVAVEADEVWEMLRTRYSWSASMRRSEPACPDRASKAAHLAGCAILRPQLAAARDAVPRGESGRVLLLADGAELWVPLLAGLRVDTELPDDETVHVALSIHALCDQPGEERSRCLSAMLRALRVGGRLIVLDRFLDGRTGRLTGGPAPGELLAEIREASLRHVVLEHVETLRQPGDSLKSTGLFTFTKIGRPERP